MVDQDRPYLDRPARTAIARAKSNIETFHKAQAIVDVEVEVEPGVMCSLVQRPLGSVGLYVPAGSAPLFSTALMLAVPAMVAGVDNIALVTPPNTQGLPDPTILEVARQCGLSKLYLAGGAQAIAALTYGTETFPMVDKLFGPGNAYVAAAKSYAASLPGGPAMDLPAGPSEVMVIADETANPAVVASDLLSQAEHDADAQVILITMSAELAAATLREVETQITQLPRADIAKAALGNGRCFLAQTRLQAMEIANAYAPEHLILITSDADQLASQVETAGAVFVGPWTPETAGDYATGANHVLPTDGAARAWSGLSLSSFMRTMTIQRMTRQGLEQLGPTLSQLARMEGLEAHARAVDLRLQETMETSDGF